MGYINNPGWVRVDRFKDSGKWCESFSVDMSPYYNSEDIYDALRKSIENRYKSSVLGYPTEGYIICLEPYNQFAHPIMFDLSKKEK